MAKNIENNELMENEEKVGLKAKVKGVFTKDNAKKVGKKLLVGAALVGGGILIGSKAGKKDSVDVDFIDLSNDTTEE